MCYYVLLSVTGVRLQISHTNKKTLEVQLKGRPE